MNAMFVFQYIFQTKVMKKAINRDIVKFLTGCRNIPSEFDTDALPTIFFDDQLYRLVH